MNRQRFRILLSAFVCFFLVGEPVLAAGKCMTFKEMRADRVRALQSGLMFAALKCIHKPQLRLQENYNELMQRYGQDLAAQSRIVQSYFRRAHGATHRRQLHKYVTGMANRYSVASFGAPQFCEDMSTLGAAVLTATDDVIMTGRFSDELLLPAPAAACEAPKNQTLVLLNRQVPDLVSIHMPEIDKRLREKARDQYRAGQ